MHQAETISHICERQSGAVLKQACILQELARRLCSYHVVCWPVEWCLPHAGIGQKRALELVLKHGSLEQVLQHIDKAKYGIPEPFPFEEARRLFKGGVLSLMRFRALVHPSLRPLFLLAWRPLHGLV